MALVYNQPQFAQNLLAKHKNSLPSFTINLHDDHWILNKGPSKFLYTQPVSTLLEDVRALRIPVDFIEIFDLANVPYYEGCMIVETTDHRKSQQSPSHGQQKEPEPIRVVLHPNAEALYADLCLLNAKYGNRLTDMDALELESKILTATLPPLTLEPDLHYTRVVNAITRKTTSIETKTRKRKQLQEPEEDESDKAKRAKLWSQYMHPHKGKPTTLTGNRRPIFDILNEITDKDEKGGYKLKLKKEAGPTPSSMPPPPPPLRSAPTPVSHPPVQAPAMPPVKKAEPLRKAEFADNPVAMAAKAKMRPPQIPHSAAPVPTPSPVNEPPKMAPPPARTPAIPTTMANSPAQYQPPIPQPSVSPHTAHPPPAVAAAVALNQAHKKGAPTKKEEQQIPTTGALPLPQTTQAIPTDMQANWQQQAPSSHYLSQPPPPKNKPAVQPQQQTPPYPARPTLPGYPNAAYPPNPAMYKNVQVQGMVHNQNPNPNAAPRNSPMSYPQPLLSRDPLRTHSQSPHPPQQQQSQQQQQAPIQASPAPQHQMPRPAPQQQQQHLMQARYNPAMQGHPIPQQHNAQQQAAARAAAHDPTVQQPMMQIPYYQYPMHMQNMRMPGVQGAAGQYMAAVPGWGRVPAGRGGGTPMPAMPPHFQQEYQQHQQQLLAAALRAQQQQHQQHQQQLQANQQHQGNIQR